MLKPVNYDERQHQVYARGRALYPETLARWTAAFAAEAPPRRPLAVLDLGSGTGRFTPALAETFGGPVTGVEPAAAMRAIAERDSRHPRVRYLAGEAANIPLPDGSVDLVLMFLSFHHYPDRPAAIAEIARVLAPDGRVLLRSTFSDNIPKLWWRPYFPRTLEVEAAMFPTVAEAAEMFAQGGLNEARLVKVSLLFEGTLAEDAERLRLRAISIFEHLTEAELAHGFAQMDAALARGEVPIPPPGEADMLVLSRS